MIPDELLEAIERILSYLEEGYSLMDSNPILRELAGSSAVMQSVMNDVRIVRGYIALYRDTFN